MGRPEHVVKVQAWVTGSELPALMATVTVNVLLGWSVTAGVKVAFVPA